MSNTVYNSTDNPVTLSYAAMPLPPANTTTKTGEVFQGQKTILEKSSEGKQSHDSSSIMAQADSSSEKGDQAYNAKQYYSAYLHYLEAKRCYELLPDNNAKTKKLAYAYFNLAWAAKQVREARRAEVYNTTFACTLLGCTLVFLPCAIYSCCQLKKDTNWVNDETFRSQLDTGLRLLDTLIHTMEQTNDISMNTDKNKINPQVRKELGWAYNLKASFYGIHETLNPTNCCGGPSDHSCFSECCFQGTSGKTIATKFDNGKKIANLKLAIEWDPSNTDYESAYKKLDANMKRPIIIHEETHIYH